MQVNIVTAIDEASVRLLDALAASQKLGIVQVCINEALAQLKGDDLSEREQAVRRMLIHAVRFDGWKGPLRYALREDEHFTPEGEGADQSRAR